MNSRILFVLITILSGCFKPPEKASNYDFPSPVDTHTKPVIDQVKKVYNINGVYTSNKFDGARLNNFTLANDTLMRVTISPENEPINHSPWYAFKIWSERDTTVYLELDYTLHFHRYPPKLSRDRKKWITLDSANMFDAVEKSDQIIKLQLSTDTLWVTAQELHVSDDVRGWAEIMAGKHDLAELKVVGKSKLGRDLLFLDLNNNSEKGKPTIVIFSRQHPPEVTGYLAMQSFVETIVEADNKFLDIFRVMVFPLLNPDGVDLGHFRHSYGGIDLNRDWAYYRQPETRQIADFIVKETATTKSNVILGLDFHSTWDDVYYTFDESVKSKISWFTPLWLEKIEEEIQSENNDYALNEQPSGLGAPVSKGWFFTQFNAESITYEIGDKTPREFIEFKGRVSAQLMMDILLNPQKPIP